MIGRLFRAHGEFCTSHPWEVIVSLFTVTACMLTLDKGSDQAANSTPPLTSSSAASAGSTLHNRQCQGWRDSCDGFEAQYNAADIILMATIRCSAVLYCYYQFRNLHKLGSKYILGE
jgi:hydroxymethylglutaryl-CoA reductase (NADPH)